VVSVHLKSGADARVLSLRDRSFAGLPGLSLPEAVVFAGDFNFMGCSGCATKVSPAEELERRRTELHAQGFLLRTPEPACSEYYRGHPGLLDAFVTRGFGTPKAAAAGYCGALSCRPQRTDKVQAYRELSDHCPLVLAP